ncbi:aquaporin SIP1-1 [Ziziphus jujuba]|uniref:Aquaporin SIP1-1 n=1 Tax=Ziziphus jujuba TaxID=326968 RepID=A0ABM3I890_ZIZJJ|nr:aquaporin SIP1-1 [Ziziphus jujuba]
MERDRVKQDMGIIQAAIGDAILTSMWVFSKPAAKVLTIIIAAYLGVQARSFLGLFISTVLATSLVVIFSFIGKALGGANFNPSTTACFYAAGLKPDYSLISMAVRFPAQAVGGIGGAKAILQVMPQKYRELLKGPSLKVDLHTGGVAEGILTFLFSFALLVIVFKGPRNMILQVYMLAVATVGLAIAGSGYTGPSMNPANAYGWAYVNNWHNTWEQFYVYWICPFIGAIIAAGVFRISFTPPVMKQKKA